jgi:branched-chain amino acid aminotransferase
VTFSAILLAFVNKLSHKQEIMKLVNVNGVITPENEAKISVFDRGFLYGDSVYEVTSTVSGKPLFWDEHLDRLENSARLMSMPLSFTRAQLSDEVKKIIEAMKKIETHECYLRLIITRGEGEIGLDPKLSTKNNLIIIAKPLPPNPTWWYEKGVGIAIVDVTRNHPRAQDPNIKSGNYLNNVLAIQEAKKNFDAFEAVMLNQAGHVAEGTTSNIWMIKNGVILTPPNNAGLLQGITRQKVLEIRGAEKNITADDLYSADEIFMTSSTREIVPVTMLNGKKVGDGNPGNMTKEIHQKYLKKVAAYIKNFNFVLALILIPLLSLEAKTLTCTHPEVCTLIKELGPALKDYSINSLTPFQGDYHDYEPSAKDLKTLLTADVLISGPTSLEPWINSIARKRAQNVKQQTIVLNPITADQRSSHFWFSPQVTCQLLGQITSALKIENKAANCLLQKEKFDLRFLNLKNKLDKYFFILTHDPLLPLLQDLQAEVMILKGHSHHEEISLKAMKNVSSVLRNTRKKIVWVFESGIRVPFAVEQLVKADHLSLRLATCSTTSDALFQTLENVLTQLENLK